MSNGKIEYSLGLATGGFLGPLANAGAKLAGFVGVTATLGGAVTAVWNQIAKGGALVDLSNRTGESVRDLAQLQFAFEQSGVAAGNIAPILQKYRQSLSGIGEMGENTAEAFSLIGISIDDLRKMDAPQALQAIFTGLNKLDRNTAAGVAGKIFGRGASGDILQLARGADGFAEAIKRAAENAEIMARNAQAFDRLGDSLGDIKLEIDTIAAGIAEEITPALNLMADQLKSKDFAGLGNVFELSMKAGIQEVTFAMSDAAVTWGGMIRKELGNASDAVQKPGFWETTGKGSLGLFSGVLGLWGQFGGALGVPGAQERSDHKIALAERMFQDIGWTGGPLNAVAEEMAKAPGSRKNVFREQLQEMLAANAGRNPGAPFSAGPNNGIVAGMKATDILKLASPSATEANALQRIGLGLGSGSSDDTRAMRVGIDRMVDHLGEIRRAVGPGGGNRNQFVNL